MRTVIALLLVAVLLNAWSAWRFREARRRADEERERFARGLELLLDAVRALGASAPVEGDVGRDGDEQRGERGR